MTTTLGYVDMHTAGEPVRIVTKNYPILNGKTILEKRRDARETRPRRGGRPGTGPCFPSAWRFSSKLQRGGELGPRRGWCPIYNSLELDSIFVMSCAPTGPPPGTGQRGKGGKGAKGRTAKGQKGIPRTWWTSGNSGTSQPWPKTCTSGARPSD